jgi:hypothetical protein
MQLSSHQPVATATSRDLGSEERGRVLVPPCRGPKVFLLLGCGATIRAYNPVILGEKRVLEVKAGALPQVCLGTGECGEVGWRCPLSVAVVWLKIAATGATASCQTPSHPRHACPLSASGQSSLCDHVCIRTSFAALLCHPSHPRISPSHLPLAPALATNLCGMPTPRLQIKPMQELHPCSPVVLRVLPVVSAGWDLTRARHGYASRNTLHSRLNCFCCPHVISSLALDHLGVSPFSPQTYSWRSIKSFICSYNF